jgi:hypothetical protein
MPYVLHHRRLTRIIVCGYSVDYAPDHSDRNEQCQHQDSDEKHFAGHGLLQIRKHGLHDVPPVVPKR